MPCPRPLALAALLAAVALAGGTGCAAQAAAKARAARLEQEVSALRYDQPLDKVWPEVRQMLVDRFYMLGGKDAEQFGQPTGLLVSLTTPARETTDEPSGLRWLETNWNKGRRYRVEGRPDAQGGCRVIFIAIIEDYTEHFHEQGRQRDYEMELALARRVAPDAANRIDDLLEAMR